MLEHAYMEQQKGSHPVFPLWLAPTQVRLCPVSDKFLPLSKKIADELEKEDIRVDIDDRVESVGKKIRDAETEWTNLIVVIGEKEQKSRKLAVRFRETGKVKHMGTSEVIKLIKEETKGFPFRPLPLPRLLTKRVVFFG
jgi:threonyl-tRNA synthetase